MMENSYISKAPMNYVNVLTRLLNTPLLISSGYLDIITSEVSINLLAGELINREKPTPQTQDSAKPTPSIAIIPIHGSLVNKNGAGSSGVTSYESIKQNIQAVLQEGIPTIGFDISSNGGEAAGTFPLADFINSLPEKYGVNTFAFVDANANSAGYALASATQTIYAADTATVGSIGAVMSLVDMTKKDAKDGISYEIMRSKALKGGHSPHEVITDAVRKQAMDSLAIWDNKFNAAMLKYRPALTMETITSLEGDVVNAVKGLSLGLVDVLVASLEDVIPLVIESTKTNSKKLQSNKTQQLSLTHKIGTTMDLQEALSKLVEVQTQLDSLKASANLDVTKAVHAERARVTSILDAKTTFAASDANVLNAISKGWSLDTVTDVFTEVKAAKDALLVIDTSGTSLGSQTPEAVAAALAKANAGKELSFEDSILQGLEESNKVTQLFKGIG